MLKEKTVAKIISGTLIGAMLLMAGGIVLARKLDPNSTGGNSSTSTNQTMQDRRGHHGFNINDIDMKKKLTDDLAGLVKAGTLTQAKADKVIAYFDKFDAERKAEMEKIKTMTPEERRAYMDNAKTTKKDPLTQLVADGVITQQEADAIAKVHCPAPRHDGDMRPPMQNGKGFGKGFDGMDIKEKLTTDLSALVKAGTLTQAKADKVVAYFTKLEADKKAEFEKVKTMTPEERRAYMEKMKTTVKDPLAQLVTDGTITQQESDAIAKTMPRPGNHHKGGMRPPMNGVPTGEKTTQS